MIVSAIVAVGENGEIGRAGGLPWPRLAADMKHFIGKTSGKAVIMGRRTWDSLPSRPLVGRRNIVVTSGTGKRRIDDAAALLPFARDQYGRRTTIDTAPDPTWAVGLAEDLGSPEAVVIGGAQLYRALWHRLDCLYLTKIGLNCPDADAFFPYPLSPAEWAEVDRPLRIKVDPDSGIRMSFHTYARRRPGGTP